MYLQSLVEYINKFIKNLYVKLDVLKILRIIKYFVEEQENKKKKAPINVCGLHIEEFTCYSVDY